MISGSLSPRHGAVLRLRIEEQPPIWRVAANILNKQPRTADKGWSSNLGGWSRCKQILTVKTFHTTNRSQRKPRTRTDTFSLYRVLVGKPEGKSHFGRPRRRWEDNIKMDLKEVGCGVWTGTSWLRIGTGGRHL